MTLMSAEQSKSNEATTHGLQQVMTTVSEPEWNQFVAVILDSIPVPLRSSS
jgi:hypothetical protein